MTHESFLDKDPEDAWDDGDPLIVKMDVLERTIDDLRANRDDRFDARRDGARRLIRKVQDELDANAENLDLILAALEAL